MKIYPYPALLLFSAVVFLHQGCREPGSRQGVSGSGVSAVLVDGVVLQTELLENRIHSTGTILANEDVEIRSEISGRIVSIRFT